MSSGAYELNHECTSWYNVFKEENYIFIC